MITRERKSGLARRGFLAGTACVAAAAAAGAASTSGARAASVEPDAALAIYGDELAGVDREIAELDRRLARIHVEVRSQCPVPQVMQALADAADSAAEKEGDDPVPARSLIVRAQSALRRDPAALDPAVPLAAKTKAIESFKGEIDAAYAHLGYSQLEALHRTLASMESDLIDKIYATPAQSLAGVVVKLRVIDRMELWSEARPEDDFHRAFLGETLRNAEKLAGLTHRRA